MGSHRSVMMRFSLDSPRPDVVWVGHNGGRRRQSLTLEMSWRLLRIRPRRRRRSCMPRRLLMKVRRRWRRMLRALRVSSRVCLRWWLRLGIAGSRRCWRWPTLSVMLRRRLLLPLLLVSKLLPTSVVVGRGVLEEGGDVHGGGEETNRTTCD